MNLPNKLTMMRVILVPFFIWTYLAESYYISLVIFIVASVTDMLDGRIARKYDMITNFGKIMDPLADKVLVYSAFCLMIPEYVPGWMLIVILAREFTISGMRTVAASEGIVIAAGMSGKIKTVLQMIAVPLILLNAAMRHSFVFPTLTSAIYIAAIAVMKEPLACFIVATTGNWLGSVLTYFMGRLGKWEWIEKWFHIKPEDVEKKAAKIDKYGTWMALLAWVPIIGDIIALALGFYRTNVWKTSLLLLIGKAGRFLIWTALMGYLKF